MRGYHINYLQSILCIIFQTFDKHPTREGTHYDAKRLYDQFRALGFDEVRIFNDFKVRKVMKELKKGIMKIPFFAL